MASSTGTKVMQLIVGAAAISSLGLSYITSIRGNITSPALQRSAIFTGDQYLLTSEDSTPAVYLDDETTPIITRPTRPNINYCTGNSGSRVCNRLMVLTGSGGKSKYTSGSFVCSTSSCANITALVMNESGALAYMDVGWTTSPSTTSGTQLIFNESPAKGGILLSRHGSGAPINVPLGATVKALWALSTVNPKTAILFTWNEFYTP